MTKQPVILFVTPVLGHPPKGGPELRIENSIKALSQISSLSLYCRIPLSQIGGDAALHFWKNYTHKIFFSPFSRKTKRGFNIFRNLLNLFSRIVIKRNIITGNIEGLTDYANIIETAQTLDADVIWLGYGNISYPLLKYIKNNSSFPVVLDTDSVWSRFVLRELPYAKNETDRKRIETRGLLKTEEEQWGTVLADVTTGVSKVDMEYYKGLTNTPAQIQLFSNVIDLNTYVHTPPPDIFKKPCVYLAGTFWPGSPMEDAARWMLDNVLPLLRQKLPNIHFYIIGRDSDTVLSDIHDNNVTITGTLSSVLPYLTNASVVVVPLRFESGTRFKILEAGACGVAVVSTMLGAEGIPVKDGTDILIADTPEFFAQAIIRVIQEPKLAFSLSSGLNKLIKNNFSLDTLVREGKNILEHVIKS